MKFTDYYYRKYEIDLLMRYGDVLVWDMGLFLRPAFTKAIAAPSVEPNCVRKVNSWSILRGRSRNWGSVRAKEIGW